MAARYAVGQVLFVVMRGKPAVVPVQVIEEITKRTLAGETTSYIVRTSPDPKGLPRAGNDVALDSIDGEVFDTAANARDALVSRVTAAVSGRVDDAVAKAVELFGPPPTAPTETGQDSDGLMVEVPDENGIPRPVRVRGVRLPSQPS